MGKVKELYATDVRFVTNRDRTAFQLVGTEVEQGPAGPRRTQNTIRLSVTFSQAAVLLRDLQELLGGDQSAPAEWIPPEKDRH